MNYSKVHHVSSITYFLLLALCINFLILRESSTKVPIEVNKEQYINIPFAYISTTTLTDNIKNQSKFLNNLRLGDICFAFPGHCPTPMLQINGVKLLNLPKISKGYRYLSYLREYGGGKLLLPFLLGAAPLTPVILNIGGGAGYFEILSRMKRPDAILHTLNPHPTHRILLEDNLLLNNISINNHMFQYTDALSSIDGESAAFTDALLTSALIVTPTVNFSQNASYAPTSYVETVSLSTFLRDRFRGDRNHSITFLMVDAPHFEDKLCSDLHISRRRRRHSLGEDKGRRGNRGNDYRNTVFNTQHFENLTMLFLVTYSVVSHSTCVAALASRQLVFMEDSSRLSQEYSRLHGRFSAPNYGLLAAYDPRKHTMTKEIGRYVSYLRRHRDRAYGADGMTFLELNAAIHIPPYNFSVDVPDYAKVSEW